MTAEAPAFAGRYKLLQKLGTGSFGTVWRALDDQLRNEVALKISREPAADTLSAQRFEREARVIARLNHENIVKIFDVGVHDATPYHAMEFVAGDTLDKMLPVSHMMRLRARLLRAQGRTDEAVEMLQKALAEIDNTTRDPAYYRHYVQRDLEELIKEWTSR